jgi:hypothetical protein
MRLINFGPGEIADRLTILNLKQLYGKQAGKDVKHFIDEEHALLAQIRSRELVGPWLEHTLELAAVNAAIWQGEEALRSYRKIDQAMSTVAHVLPIVDIAFRLQELNDRRHELITLINVNTGDHLGEEKV